MATSVTNTVWRKEKDPLPAPRPKPPRRDGRAANKNNDADERANRERERKCPKKERKKETLGKRDPFRDLMVCAGHSARLLIRRLRGNEERRPARKEEMKERLDGEDAEDAAGQLAIGRRTDVAPARDSQDKTGRSSSIRDGHEG